MNKKLQMQHRQANLALPTSTEQRIRASERQIVEQRIETDLWPFIMKMAHLEGLLQRFDQCVIDRGAGMVDRLNIIQQAIYKQYSDMEREYSFVGFPDANVKLKVDERLGGYHRLFEGDSKAYDDLLDLTDQMDISKTLVMESAKINRGGTRNGLRPHLQLIYEGVKALKPPENTDLARYAHAWVNRLNKELADSHRSPTSTEQQAIAWVNAKSDDALRAEVGRLLKRGDKH